MYKHHNLKMKISTALISISVFNSNCLRSFVSALVYIAEGSIELTNFHVQVSLFLEYAITPLYPPVWI